MTDLATASATDLTKSTSHLLEVRDLSVTFPQRSGDVTAVRDVSYWIDKGEFLGIVGESGSGKSVSSLAVLGLLPSTARVSGNVTFEGRPLLKMNDREMSGIRGSEISIIFQDPLSALTPVYTVGTQIAEALELHDRSLSKRAAHARAVELLATVGIPDPERRAKAFPHEFSGGMRQRVMIAIAIANDPKLIVADEPTTALDVTVQAQILDVLHKAKELTGAAVVLITHDLGVVAGQADRIAVMYAGRIVETGTVDEVFYEPAMPYTVGLLRSMPNLAAPGREPLVPLEGRPPSLSSLGAGCPFAPRCSAAMPICQVTEPVLDGIPGGTGHASACYRSAEIFDGSLPREKVFPRPERRTRTRQTTNAQVVLDVQGLVRHFPLMAGSVFKRSVGSVKAVDGVSLTLRSGRTLGLVGESGCGKTTTILEILELVAPQSGRICVKGKDVATMNAAERRLLRKDIQVVFQDPMSSLDPRLPIQDIIAEPLTVHKASAQERHRRVAEVLDLVGLEPAMASRYPHEFSGGQRQRIGIARALVTDPQIVVLDEPVSALDVSVQAGVINLLQELQDRLGLSYVFVAHDLAVVRSMADDIAVMYLGRIVESGPADNIFEEPLHPYTQALLSAVPMPDPITERQRERILLRGDLPSPTEDDPGCSFRTRCPLYPRLSDEAQSICSQDTPALRSIHATKVACHHAERSGVNVN